MRTNIEIDDQLMTEALAAGPFKTKKEAVEAGLVLLKRQAAMRELAKMGGAVTWGWDDDTQPNVKPKRSAVAAPVAHHVAESVPVYAIPKKSSKTKAQPASGVKPRARR